MAWDPVYESEDSDAAVLGYTWVPDDESYDQNGNLLGNLTRWGSIGAAWGNNASALITYQEDGSVIVKMRYADDNYDGPKLHTKNRNIIERFFFGPDWKNPNKVEHFINSLLYGFLNDISVNSQMFLGVSNPVNLDASYVLGGKDLTMV